MLKVDHAVGNFLCHCEYERSLSGKTIKAYGTDLRQFMGHLGVSGVIVSEIGRDEIREHVRWLSERFKPRSVKRKVASLKAFFAHLEFEDAIPVSPFRKLRINIRGERSLPRVVPFRIVSRLLRHIYRERERRVSLFLIRDIAVIEILFATGARVSEVSGILCSDVDLRQGSVRIMWGEWGHV